MYSITAMDNPSLKHDNSILFKSCFIMTVKYNNFVLPTLPPYNCVPEKGQSIWKKDRETRGGKKRKALP